MDRISNRLLSYEIIRNLEQRLHDLDVERMNDSEGFKAKYTKISTLDNIDELLPPGHINEDLDLDISL